MPFARLEKRYKRLRRSFAKRTKTTFIFDHKIHGRLLLDTSEPMSLALYSGFEYEIKELAFVEKELEAEPADVFLDIGANWGGYSLLAARCGVPRIEAFEPNRKVFGLLGANVTLNRLHRQIRIWNVAAGDADGETDLHIDPSASEVSSLAPESMPERWHYGEVQKCMVRRLGDFLPLDGQNVFMKIDVEGFEKQAIAGLDRLLRANRVRLLVEVLKDPDDFAAYAETYGLAFRSRFGRNCVFETA